MSREEVQAFLTNWQMSMDGLQKQIDAAVRELHNVKREDLPRFLAAQKAKWQAWDVEQQLEWERFVDETGLQVEGDAEAEGTPGAGSGEVTPFNVRLRSLEQRVAAMGGIPALGAVVLPRLGGGERAGLKATASPAAVEIMRGRLGSDADAATPLRKSSAGEGAPAATPLVQLRRTPGPAAGGAGGANGALCTPGAAPPSSELAAAIQRRAQRAASEEPPQQQLQQNGVE